MSLTRTRAAAGMGSRRGGARDQPLLQLRAARLRWHHLRRVVVVPACCDAEQTPALLDFKP